MGIHGTSSSIVALGNEPILANTPDFELEGWAIDLAGDFNSDGHLDLVAGDSDWPSNAGIASLSYGSISGYPQHWIIGDLSRQGIGERDFFGSTVRGAGDVNGDGYDDFLVYAADSYIDETGFTHCPRGRAELFYGKPSVVGPHIIPDWEFRNISGSDETVTGTNSQCAHYAKFVGNADFNGDGYSDMVISVPEYPLPSYRGRLLVFYGSAQGFAATPNNTINGAWYKGQLGFGLAKGDINGDRYDDLIAGEPEGGGDLFGRVYVYFGSANGLPTSASWAHTENNFNKRFGYTVSSGDWNCDGFDDIAVGEPLYSTPSMYAVGRVYVYYGSTSVPDSSNPWIKEGDQTLDQFGGSQNSARPLPLIAADVNGDSCDDFFLPVYAYEWDAGNKLGKVWLFSGKPDGLANEEDWSIVAPFPYQTANAVNLGDINQDGAEDIVIGFESGSVSLNWGFYGTPTNVSHPPSVTIEGPYFVDEGSLLTVSAIGDDPDGGLLTFRWDLNNDGIFEATGQNISFSAINLDGPSIHTISVQVTDESGLVATDQTTVNVENVNPIYTSVSNNGPINESASATISAVATDPAGINDPLNYEFDCDNDHIFEIGPQINNEVACSFADNGSFTVNLRVIDDDNGEAYDSTIVVVNNVDPNPNASPNQTVFHNELVIVSGNWTDPAGSLDDAFIWSWDLDGDSLPDDNGSASYGNTITRNTSFVVDGIATLTFTVTDKDGGTNSDTVDIEVINRVPVADTQSVITNEDSAVNITLTGLDLDGDMLAFSLLDSPNYGVLNGDLPYLTYTPNADFNGSDNFTFKVNDGLSDSSEATVNITVTSVNDPPAAIDDTAVTDEDLAVVVDVQANDNAGPANEDQTLTTTTFSNPPNGLAVINPDGTITYTPNPDYNGTDEFNYTICDSDNACITAMVTVLIDMVNDPPIAIDDSVTTLEDTSVTIDVAANDFDVDGNLDSISAIELSQPANGILVNNDDGTFHYIPELNFNGSDSFTYEICDTDDVCDDAAVNITVIPVNDNPVCTYAVPSSDTLWPPNHQFELITINGVIDVEGDLITIIIDSIFQDELVDSNGDGSHTSDGRGIGTDTAELRVERQGNGNGRYYHVGYTASDGNGGTCSGIVLVSVPKSQGKKGVAIDDGPIYDSTIP